MQSPFEPKPLARRFTALLSGCLFVWFLGTLAASAQDLPLRGYLSAHDPSTIIQCKNRWYQFWTGQGILSRSSADKVYWTPGPAVFTNPPAWTTSAVPGFTGLFWAPDVLYFNNQYHLYYAGSTWGSQVSAIGLVTNPTLDPADPSYAWTDQGPVMTSTNGSPYNCIDPSFSWDNSGNLWMAFGSYWTGIYLVQLDPVTGLRISPSSPTTQLAFNSSIEASYLWRRGGYYYLFANWGSCCSGVNSTYNIRVGRATSITGPYLDRNGSNMVSSAGTLFMQANGKYCGPGHVGIVSDNGQQTFSYHYYDANAWSSGYGNYGAADFSFTPLSWTADDWPVYFNDWSAVYNFEADARDENGQYYGLLQNGAAIVLDPTYGHVLDLNGTNQYVWFPPGVAYGQTFVAVVRWRGGGAWQRIFDFGTDTSRTFMMTPASGDNVLRCDMNPGNNFQTIQWTHPLPTNVWTQVALTLDGTQGILYVNGAPVVTNTSMNLLPLNVAPQTNSLGRSKFSADPYFNGQYASFRVYGRVLSPAEIAAPLPTIAQPASGSVYWPGKTLSFSGSAADFASRPLGASNLTWQINYVQDGQTNRVFGPVSGISSGTFAIPTTATGEGNYVVVLTATDNSSRQSTVSTTLTPAHPPASWSSYYPLQADANDVNGHYNGTLHNGASFVNDATRGSVLNLNGVNQYVSFPPGLGGMQTFLAWVKWNGGGAWQRIYDFGNDTTHYSVLTPLASSGKLRFNISVNGPSGEQIVDGPAALPIGVWTHVAVVMNGTSVVLYTNGTPAATNLFANLVPQNLNATNLYFGKSQFVADPYFSGQLSSVRIFSRPLSAAEIVGPRLTITQPVQGATYHPGDTIHYGGSAVDFYDTWISPSNWTWRVTYVNAGVTNTVVNAQSGSASGSFSIPYNGAGATNGYYQVWLSAVDSLGRAATNGVSIYPAPASLSPAWGSFYAFTSGAQDSSNLYNGTLKNGASIVSDPVHGKVLSLAPLTSQYVSLPSGVSGAETISGWVNWSGGNAWQRVFDFGQNTNSFIYLTPSDNTSRMQCVITGYLPVYNNTLEAPAPLPINQWTHVAVVMDGRQGILYVNGNAVAVNNSVNLLPSDLGATNCNFGKSQFPADPYFNGKLSALRLNSYPVPLEQLVAPMPVMTQPTNGALFAGGQALSFAGTATDYSGLPLNASAFSWSGELHSNGVTVAAFGPLAGVTSGSYFVANSATTDTNSFYRFYLTVTDTNGRQQTISQDVPAQTSQLSFSTVPSGLQLALNGQSFTTPASMSAVAGMNEAVTAFSSQMLGGSNYQFVVWSDGGAAAHNFIVPGTNSAFTASYVQPAIGLSAAAGNVQLTWPGWAQAMKLYSTPALTPPVVWSPVTNTPTSAGGNLSLTLPATNGTQFYRLALP